ncbi:YbgA family protein [Salinicoccus siamensis]|uniref:YbgA family protein n=1 Tax=Salinicoccus siamensis TaxID=381830 RepID=A0ABV5Z4I1_9STAP
MKERRETERLWAREKYRVMYHSQQHYDRLREALKRDAGIAEVKGLIEDAIAIPPTKGSMMNAFDHIWGYFTKGCTNAERDRYANMKQEFKAGNLPKEEMLDHLKSLAVLHQQKYLLDSTLLFPAPN